MKFNRGSLFLVVVGILLVACVAVLFVAVQAGPSAPKLMGMTWDSNDLPAVTGVYPTAGQIFGYDSVTINGSGFTGVTSVMFGGNASRRYTIVSDTMINAIAPEVWSSGTVDVTVTTLNGSSSTGPQDQYTYLPYPIVIGVNPSVFAAAPINVEIVGTGFTGATIAMDTPFDYRIISDTEIAVYNVNRTVVISITTPGGTDRAVITYCPPPPIPLPTQCDPWDPTPKRR